MDNNKIKYEDIINRLKSNWQIKILELKNLQENYFRILSKNNQEISDIINKTTEEYNSKIKVLESYNTKFISLISLTDEENRLRESNEQIAFKEDKLMLKTNNQELITKLKNRRLNESEYWSELFPEKKEITALVKVENEKNKLPNKIDASLRLQSGNSQKYLKKKCTEYKLSVQDLQEIVYIKREYKTNLPCIFNLIKKGYNIDQIEGFFETRELIQEESTPNKKLNVSIKQLERFYRVFFNESDESIYPELLNEEMIKLKETTKCFDVDSAIKTVIKTSRELETTNLETICAFIESNRHRYDPDKKLYKTPCFIKNVKEDFNEDDYSDISYP